MGFRPAASSRGLGCHPELLEVQTPGSDGGKWSKMERSIRRIQRARSASAMNIPLLRRVLRGGVRSGLLLWGLGLVLPSLAGAAQPVITSPSTLDVSYNPEDRGGYLFAYRIQATNTPTSFGAAPLAPNLTVDSTTGIILGDSSRPGVYNLTLTASNADGTASAPLQIRVHPASVGIQSSPGTYYTGDQIRYTVTAPGPIVVGQPILLSATASSGLPVTLALISGNATLTGSSLTVNDGGAVVVRGTQVGNNAFLPAAADISLSASRAAQTLDFVSPVSAIVIGQPIRLSANASSGLPVTFAVVSGSATVAGDALTVTGPGPVVVRATQAGSSAFNPTSVDLTITGAVRAAQSITLPAASTDVFFRPTHLRGRECFLGFARERGGCIRTGGTQRERTGADGREWDRHGARRAGR